MDQQTNDEKPSSTEGGEVKVGDKVWVLCEVVMVYRDRAALYMDIRHDNAVFEAKRLSKVVKISAYPFRTTSGEAFKYARIEVQGE